jgi:hypothetical protein
MSSVPLVLSWNPASSACRYELQAATNGGRFQPAGRIGNTEAQQQLDFQMQYQFRVRAITCEGANGRWSTLPPR